MGCALGFGRRRQYFVLSVCVALGNSKGLLWRSWPSGESQRVAHTNILSNIYDLVLS